MDFGGQPLLKMNNGLMIPQLGFGVFLIKDLAEAEKACLEAFKVGYRHIDTAHRYDNERGVGAAIKKVVSQEKIYNIKIISHRILRKRII